MQQLLPAALVISAVVGSAVAQWPGPGPETCGQDRAVLADWFLEHGSPSLLLDPRPPYVEIIEPDPYDDPSNPPDRNLTAK